MNQISTITRSVLRTPVTWVLLLAVAVVAVIGGTGTPAAAYGPTLTHNQAASKLREVGISWSSSGNCSNRNNPRCTSFEGIRSTTIEGIIHFKRVSGCAVNITGGTEVGHAGGTYSHGTGYKVDISRSQCVTSYIVTRYPEIGRRGDGARQFIRGDATYALEPSHWDILYR